MWEDLLAAEVTISVANLIGVGVLLYLVGQGTRLETTLDGAELGGRQSPATTILSRLTAAIGRQPRNSNAMNAAATDSTDAGSSASVGRPKTCGEIFRESMADRQQTCSEI